MTPTELVLSKLNKVKQTGKGKWEALCPAHDDHEASLSITEGEDGRVLLCCHACRDQDFVVQALGLKMRDLFPERDRREESSPMQGKKQSKPAARYPYVDDHGTVLYEVVRYEPKRFVQRQPDGAGGWVWNMDGITPVPYQLPRLLLAVAQGLPVYIVEGERDVATLKDIGLVATCNHGGAGKWREPLSPYLTGANVILLPDNDQPGCRHMMEVACSVDQYADSVKYLLLPDLPRKGDVSDWLKTHTREEFDAEVASSAKTWIPGCTIEPSDQGEGFALSDLSNAERLIAAHGENLRYDVNRGAWLIWNGKRWEYDQTSEIDRLAMRVVRSMYSLLKEAGREEGKKLYDHIKKSESQPRLAAMVTLAAKLPGMTIQAKDLDHDPCLLNCLNGTVDLRSGKLRGHAREDLMTRLCECEYDPASECPRWLQFLDEVFQSDTEVTGFVRRLAGYVLTADTREESVFILTGKGQNGKSKMVETLRAVLGDYAADTPFTTFIERRSDSATNDLAALVGKRLITASEGEDTQSFNESLLKQLSGGDPITCRFLHKEFFTYTPTFKVLFSTNEVPRIRSQNFAMKRRLKLIPFRQRFYDREDGRKPVKDDQLLPKLLAEKNGILAWMVEGCLEWREHGLMTPRVIRAEVERLFESQDLLAEFIEDRCEVGPGREVQAKSLWIEYSQWCGETNREVAFKAPQWFSKDLTQREGIDTKRGKRGGRSVRLLSGIGLRFDDTYTVDEREGDANDANLDSGGSTPMKEEIEQEPRNSSSCVIASPEEVGEDLLYTCGSCKAQVRLRHHKPRAYGYSCESCGHSGVVPHYEYQRWLEKKPKTDSRRDPGILDNLDP